MTATVSPAVSLTMSVLISRTWGICRLRATIVASIGPVTAEAATQCNIATAIVPANFTVPALVDAIVDYFAKQAKEQPV